MAVSNSTITSRKKGKSIETETQTSPVKEQNGIISRTPTKQTFISSQDSALSQSISFLQIWSPILLLIFGGCCSNVYTLESLIQTSPSSGGIITGSQFLLTALFTLPSQFSLHNGNWRTFFLRPRSIPFQKHIIFTAFFLAINMLNNYAFNYRISVPLHIILRSAGPVTTMAIGRVVGGRRYPTQKVIAVLLLFAGVVLAAVSDAYAKSPQSFSTSSQSTSSSSSNGFTSQAPGFAILTLALLLSALMGLYTDAMYTTHGRSSAITYETLFYSHTLSLPYFSMQLPNFKSELVTLSHKPATLSTTTTSNTPNTSSRSIYSFSSTSIPLPLVLLFANALTQYLCITGVNRLSAKSSSLTVGIVLNVRKLVSLVLSIWLFGNQLPFGVVVGAAVVFVGGGLYALPTRSSGSKMEKKGEGGGSKKGKKEL